MRSLLIHDDDTAMFYALITLIAVAAMLALLPESGVMKLGY